MATEQCPELQEDVRRTETLQFATVVAIHESAPSAQEPADLAAFRVGANVRVLDGQYKGLTGTVVEALNQNGFVRAQLPDGIAKWFYADHANDSYFAGVRIEPASGSSPRLLLPGDRVKIVETNDKDDRFGRGATGVVVRTLSDTDRADEYVDVLVVVAFNGCPRLPADHLWVLHKPPRLLALVDDRIESDAAHRTAIVLLDREEVEVALPAGTRVNVGDTLRIATEVVRTVVGVVNQS